jgi:hypothetical protein
MFVFFFFLGVLLGKIPRFHKTDDESCDDVDATFLPQLANCTGLQDWDFCRNGCYDVLSAYSDSLSALECVVPSDISAYDKVCSGNCRISYFFKFAFLNFFFCLCFVRVWIQIGGLERIFSFCVEIYLFCFVLFLTHSSSNNMPIPITDVLVRLLPIDGDDSPFPIAGAVLVSSNAHCIGPRCLNGWGLVDNSFLATAQVIDTICKDLGFPAGSIAQLQGQVSISAYDRWGEVFFKFFLF